VAADKVFGMSRLCRVSDKCLSQIRKRFFTIIELTKCIHEFSEYEPTNFFTNISQEEENIFLIGQNKAIFLGVKHLRKSKQTNYTIFGRKYW
jgi:hypothetical protein